MGDSAEGGWSSATPMRNSDFKALLTTPRPAGAQQQQQKRNSDGGGFKAPRPKSISAEDRDKKFKKPHPKRAGGKPGQEGDKKEGEQGPGYRDRAKERRDGLNVDFADAEQELAARGLGPTALASLSIEQSKFLGGDIAHTHLVKGLDYALLNQTRQTLNSSKDGSGGGGAGDTAMPPSAAAAAAAAVAEATAAAQKQKQSVKFATPLGRSLYQAVFRAPAGRTASRNLVREMFQPRRTAFVFEEGEGASDVPTTLRRSKADCPPAEDVVSASSDLTLLERISKIMGYINQTAGKGGKRTARDSQYIRSILSGVNPAAPGEGQVHGQLVMKGQAVQAAGGAHAKAAAAAAAAAPQGAGAAAAAAADEDDDIFGDAGTDYAPALPQKKTEAGGRRAEGLFDNRDHQRDMMQPPHQHQQGAAGMDMEEGELEGQQRQMQQQQQQQQQGYGYPAAAAGYGGAADSYYQQQQQQAYGADPYAAYGLQQAQQRAAEQPKWRVSTKPGASAAALQGFADDAYAECFPSMGVVVDDDEDDDPKAAKAAAAAAAAAGGEGGAAAAAGGGGGGKGKRGAAAAADDPEKKLQHKLSREVQQMQGIFKDKGWGNEGAFKKQDKLDSVAATPARKRLRI